MSWIRTYRLCLHGPGSPKGKTDPKKVKSRKCREQKCRNMGSMEQDGCEGVFYKISFEG